MFDWFWEFLYLISAAIYQLIDGVMSCANKLCGIETITVKGEETDLLTFLMNSDQIQLGFRAGAIVGFTFIFFFTIYAILRAIVKEKPDESPAHIIMKAGKNILIYLFIPFIFVVLIWAMNMIMGEVMYAATRGGSKDSLGFFLAQSFSGDDCVLPEGFNYKDASAMWQYTDLTKYNYFFSWVSCVAILFALAKSLLMFVDRVFSIIILYVVSPFPLASSIIDEGSHFKLWRDQLLVKFFVGYGTILGLNIYAIVVSLVAKSYVVFFSNGFLNFLMKIAIILGGAVSLEKLMGLIGNLVSAGAGTQEMQQAAMAAKSLGGGLAKATGMSLASDIIGGAWQNKKREMSQKLSDSIFGTGKGQAQAGKQKKEHDAAVENSLNNITEMLGNMGNGGNKAKDAIGGEGGGDDKKNDNNGFNFGPEDQQNGGGENANNDNPVNDAISGGGADDAIGGEGGGGGEEQQ